MSQSADGDLQLLQGIRIGDSQIAFAAVTECRSGHGSYFSSSRKRVANSSLVMPNSLMQGNT